MPKKYVPVNSKTASQSGEYAAHEQHEDEKDAQNARAQRKAGWYSDDAYMDQVGKEAIKDQQDNMRKTADEEDAGYKHKIPSYKKGGKVRKTGLALVHKGEKVIPKHKVSPKRKK